MSMRIRLTDLPDYDEFRTLFAQYKIANWTTRITPTHSINRTLVPKIVNVDGVGVSPTPTGNSSTVSQPEIPNVDIFIVPSTYHLHLDNRNWAAMTVHQIQDVIN